MYVNPVLLGALGAIGGICVLIVGAAVVSWFNDQNPNNKK